MQQADEGDKKGGRGWPACLSSGKLCNAIGLRRQRNQSRWRQIVIKTLPYPLAGIECAVVLMYLQPRKRVLNVGSNLRIGLNGQRVMGGTDAEMVHRAAWQLVAKNARFRLYIKLEGTTGLIVIAYGHQSKLVIAISHRRRIGVASYMAYTQLHSVLKGSDQANLSP